MNRYIQITIFTLVCFCVNINKMYACDEDPIPVMTSDPSVYKIFMKTTDSKTLSSNSYDPDDGEPHGSNNGIKQWKWDINNYNEGNGYWEDQGVDVNSSCTFSPSALGLGPGRYAVDLNVLDNDDIWINGHSYHLATQDWCGTRDFYIPGIKYFQNQSGDDEHYIPTGEGETFYYSLLPRIGADWEPHLLSLFIRNEAGTLVYGYLAFGSVINDPNIPLESSIEWNGLGNQGVYDDLPLPPGNYTVTLNVNKSSITAYKTNQLKIVGVDKIQYKIGSDPYQDCPNPFVVAKGADVTFKAIVDPSGASWPYQKPTWHLNGSQIWIGQEKEISFNTASSNPTDYKLVEAKCGNTKSINVVVVDLSALVINANRTSTPVESSFPVKSGEHFEIDGTFQFDLMLSPWPTPVKLDSEIWDLDYFNEIFAMGTGSTITTSALDEGTCKVRYFFDNNTNGTSYVGTNDPYTDSPSFEAQELTYHYLTFAKSSTVSGTPDTTAACNAATALIRRKDTADDWRATAMIMPEGSLSEIPASTHDPVRIKENSDGNIDTETCDFHGDVGYFVDYPNDDSEVFIVDKIELYHYDETYRTSLPGFAVIDYKYEIFIKSSYVNDGRTLIHELGHSCGLRHNNANTNNVMYYDRSGGNRTLLTDSETVAFE